MAKKEKKKYQESSQTLDRRLEYHKKYYQEHKGKWKKKDGEWKKKGTHNREKYRAAKEMAIVSRGKKKALTSQQKRFQKSLERGGDLIRAIKIAYPNADTAEKITTKLLELRENTLLTVSIKQFFEQANKFGLGTVDVIVKLKMIIDEAEPGADPRLLATALKAIEFLMKLSGKMIDRSESVSHVIWEKPSAEKAALQKQIYRDKIKKIEDAEVIDVEVEE